MARTVPTTTYEAPGNLVTGELWNSGPKALNDFLRNRPAMVATDNLIQSIPNATWTPINYGTNYLDTDGGHNTSTNSQMFFAQVAGYYWVRGSVSINPSGVGNGVSRMDTAIAKNGAILIGSSQFLTKGANVNCALQASFLPFLNPGDRVELWLRQNTGITIQTDTGTVGINNGMSVIWIHS